jgi:hypothetical protein
MEKTLNETTSLIGCPVGHVAADDVLCALKVYNSC